MNENLIIALQITIIGMALVFGVIVVLWVTMILLVRLTAQRASRIEQAAPTENDQSDLKCRAAVAAVSVALAQVATSQLRELPEQPAATTSPWQTVQRSRHLTQRTPPRRLRR